MQQAPHLFRQRVVVMDAGNALHAAPIAQRQTAPVHVLEHADMRLAVPGDRYLLVGRQFAGHGLAPQQFVAQVLVGKAVDGVELVQRGGDIGLGRGDEFQQRFGIVGGNLRVRQRRAQGQRMRRLCQHPLGRDAQGFALHAAQALAQKVAVGVLGQQGQTAGELIVQADSVRLRVPAKARRRGELSRISLRECGRPSYEDTGVRDFFKPCAACGLSRR